MKELTIFNSLLVAWLALAVVVFVALFFIPKFLRCGIYTMPEFLEYRYHNAARGIMA